MEKILKILMRELKLRKLSKFYNGRLLLVTQTTFGISKVIGNIVRPVVECAALN